MTAMLCRQGGVGDDGVDEAGQVCVCMQASSHVGCAV